MKEFTYVTSKKLSLQLFIVAITISVLVIKTLDHIFDELRIHYKVDKAKVKKGLLKSIRYTNSLTI